MARDLDEQLTKDLTDAHSIEVQALAQLRTAPELRGTCKRGRTLVASGGDVDAAVGAALEAHPRDELPALVKKYLADAHAVEEQAIGLLERAPRLVQNSELEAVFDDHLSETRDHLEFVQSRLTALGGDSSLVFKDAAMRLGALNWASFFQGHPDTSGKLVAFAYAFEHLEIGGYEQLRCVANAAGDPETARMVETILGEERNAASSLAGVFDAAAGSRLPVGVSG